MPNSTINATVNGLNSTAGNAATLDLQVAGSTVASVTSTGVAVTGTMSSTGVSTFAAGSVSAPSITFTGDTNTGIYSSGADTVVMVTGGTAAVTVDSGQRTKFPTTIGVGDATPSTSGSGVSFPATQSASTNANTLDDYEQGSFTATMTPNTSGTITLTSAEKTLIYTKIGRQVTITGGIVISSVSSPVGASIRIGTLPFLPGETTWDYRAAGSCVFYDASAATFTVLPLQCVASDLTYLNLLKDASTVAADDQFYIGITYMADD